MINTSSAHRAARAQGTALVPFRTALRWPAALGLVTTAVVHVPLVGPHLEEAPYVGCLFIALAAACLVLAGGLVLRDNLLIWAMAGFTCLLAVAAYLLSRTVGLPQIGDDIGDWADPLGITALAAESLTVLLAATAVLRTLTRPRTVGDGPRVTSARVPVDESSSAV
ncbi:hypothetical protein [Actinopolymorpha rutila]|uniref:Uncharacterized protein n=1 Tax=Actinopolymorpha rutila TaxID=446787 RepID=A0A852ZDR4_9ACTN|nr:hypothetical protein [Actinopolymorpha rutila]NYH91311.1 hypothetical protein [Actinopolymorpha rutila]